MTTVRSPSRFGRIVFDGEHVAEFYEKPRSSEGWISGGFFVLNTKAIDYIEDDDTIWEHDAIDGLVQDRQLRGYCHYGFWSCTGSKKKTCWKRFGHRENHLGNSGRSSR